MSKSSNEPTVTEGYVHVDSFLDDNYTSVTLSGPDWKSTGNARREPGDVPNDETGFLLAFGRALENAGRKLTKRANGLVKHADDVKAAKEAKAAGRLPTSEELLAWLQEVTGGIFEEPFEYEVTNRGGLLPGPDFDDPSDPWLTPLGGALSDDGETLFVRFHFAGAEG